MNIARTAVYAGYFIVMEDNFRDLWHAFLILFWISLTYICLAGTIIITL